MWEAFFSAIALVLVFEGLMPFISPEKFRQYLSAIMTLSNSAIRRGGLISMLVGAGLLYFIRQGGV